MKIVKSQLPLSENGLLVTSIHCHRPISADCLGLIHHPGDLSPVDKFPYCTFCAALLRYRKRGARLEALRDDHAMDTPALAYTKYIVDIKKNNYNRITGLIDQSKPPEEKPPNKGTYKGYRPPKSEAALLARRARNKKYQQKLGTDARRNFRLGLPLTKAQASFLLRSKSCDHETIERFMQKQKAQEAKDKIERSERLELDGEIEGKERMAKSAADKRFAERGAIEAHGVRALKRLKDNPPVYEEIDPSENNPFADLL